MTDAMGQTGSRARLLVVDDVMENILVVNQILKDFHDVQFAMDGPRALDMARTQTPDLILLDAMMPGMDGYEVCRRLQQDAAAGHVPVIFLTALNAPEDETRALEAGAVDFISKPINPAVLRARVNTHLTLKRQRDALMRMARTDGLTGVANRKEFDETLEREWRRCARAGQPLAVVMVDIDHFKAFNDRYGHPAGDDCLRAVAGALACAVSRPADLVARYGGEEFVAVLPDTDREGGLRVAEAMRAAVARLAMPHEASGAAPHVTISVGVAVQVPSAAESEDSLLRAADAALYDAKRQGRNRCRLAEATAV